MLLARAGLSVLAVERSGLGADTLSTHALTKPAVLQLSRWGVLDAVRHAGTPRVDAVSYHYGDEQVDVPIRPDGDVDGLYAPRRRVLDRILVEAAIHAGATVAHRTNVVDLITDGRHRVAGVIVNRHGTTTSVRSRLVIGADGAHSFVARRVGAPIEQRAHTSSATIYTYVPGLPDHAYRNYFRPSMAAGLIPTNDGAANVWVAVGSRHFRRDARADVAGFFHDRLRRADPALAARVARHHAGGFRSFGGIPGFTRRAWGAGWALVGDAVYFKDPVSAHGMTDALIGAELLARSVIAIFDGSDETEALTRYSTERSSLAAPMMRAVAELATYRWEPARVQHLHLEMNQAMRREWRTLRSLDATRHDAAQPVSTS
jgi:flavin-dependent dehydrogenase